MTIGDLVFVGTVASIEAASAGAPTLRFIVRMKVEHVEVGVFTEPSFSFRIHSAAQAGLEVGQSYTVRATRTATGYTVDPMQWRR